MGGRVYCRTCAAPPGDVTKRMIDIFANIKLIKLLSTLKEWQLDIMEDDDLPQCICETCELALISIDDFRIQALRAKEYLQTRLNSFKNCMVEDVEAISDNENDLDAKATNYYEAEIYNSEAIPNSKFPIVMCEFVNNANEKVSENKQLNKLETNLNAVNEQTGELLFDSNIESSRPPEFQVVLIEEHEEAQLQWISEDEHTGVKEDQLRNNVISQSQEFTRQCEGVDDGDENKYNTTDSIKFQSYISNTFRQSANINELRGDALEEEKEINAIKDNSIGNRHRQIKDNKDKKEKTVHNDNCKEQEEGTVTANAEILQHKRHAQKQKSNNKNSTENAEHFLHSGTQRANELMEDDEINLKKNLPFNLLNSLDADISAQFEKNHQLPWLLTETTTAMPLHIANKNATLTDNQIQLKEIQVLLSAISEQVSSFEASKDTNNYTSDDLDLDLQSIFMNDLTLQMINANVNIVEEDLQMDEFETLLAAVDEQDCSLKNFKSKQDDAVELIENQRVINEVANLNCEKICAEGENEEINSCEETKCMDIHSNECIRLQEMETEIKNYEHDQHMELQKKIPTSKYEHSLEKYVDSGDGGGMSNVIKETLNEPLDKEICNKEYLNSDNTMNSNTITSIKGKKKVPKKTTAPPDRTNKKLSKNINNLRCRLCVYKIAEQPIFITPQLLQDHIATIHDDKERPYNCPHCTARYRTRSGCVAHINAIHLKKVDNCKLCNKIVAGGSGQMRMHIERNHTHGNYTCEICQLELKNISLYNFKYHKRWHDENKLLRCELCDKAFVTRTHLMAHKVTHTRQGEFLCAHCGKSTRSKWELRTHLYAIHGEGDAPLKCNYCDEKFTQHIQKRAHLERYHPNEITKRTFVPCSKCDKQFSTEINLQRHIKKHHNEGSFDIVMKKVAASTPPKYEGFMCAHCPRKYRSKYALIKHLKVHTKMPDKPYSCPDCHMHFKHFSELDRHDLQHHATVRPYRCDECSKRFSTRTALRIHRQVHEVKGRNFRCPECNQRFKFEKSLNLHRTSHKTMRHSCDICNKSYIRLTQLKTHKSRYHKISSDSEEE